MGVATRQDALGALRTIGRPCIVKPSRNSGSRGVTHIEERHNRSGFIRAFDRALQESRDPSVVIEEYVEGPEFSVEILSWNGKSTVIAVTDKVTTGTPHFVETGHSQPTRLAPSRNDLVIDAALRGVDALGLDWTAAHAEVKMSERGPLIIEIGARLGGDYITTELVPRSTGIDMVGGAIRLALGEPPDLQPVVPPKAAAIRYLVPEAGTVESVCGVDEARAMPGVDIVCVDVRPGDEVPEVTSSLTRGGHVIAKGHNTEGAIRNAEAACRTIQIRTRHRS
jgi:biotin carboxylase